jgi:hypothetical protein
LKLNIKNKHYFVVTGSNDQVLTKYNEVQSKILKGTHPRIIPARFGLIRFRGFRGEDLNVKVYDVQTEDGRQVMAKVGHVS